MSIYTKQTTHEPSRSARTVNRTPSIQTDYRTAFKQRVSTCTSLHRREQNVAKHCVHLYGDRKPHTEQKSRGGSEDGGADWAEWVGAVDVAECCVMERYMRHVNIPQVKCEYTDKKCEYGIMRNAYDMDSTSRHTAHAYHHPFTLVQPLRGRSALREEDALQVPLRADIARRWELGCGCR